MTPSEVVIRSVTKFRPGEATNTSARSIVFTFTALSTGVAVLVYKHLSAKLVQGLMY